MKSTIGSKVISEYTHRQTHRLAGDLKGLLSFLNESRPKPETLLMIRW
jgi:hypothetical protein